MGTGKVQTDKIPEIIKEFDAFKKRIFPIMGGDDTLFDHFIRASNRMEQLADPSYTGWGRMAAPQLGIVQRRRVRCYSTGIAREAHHPACQGAYRCHMAHSSL
jgi:hypothetical protein